MGLLDPSTSDGRVIFFLPWEGLTIAGTTDSPTEVTHNPEPTEADIKFILSEIKNYLSPDVRGSFVCVIYAATFAYMSGCFSEERRCLGGMERHKTFGYRSRLHEHSVDI